MKYYKNTKFDVYYKVEDPTDFFELYFYKDKVPESNLLVYNEWYPSMDTWERFVDSNLIQIEEISEEEVFLEIL